MCHWFILVVISENWGYCFPLSCFAGSLCLESLKLVQLVKPGSHLLSISISISICESIRMQTVPFQSFEKAS